MKKIAFVLVTLLFTGVFAAGCTACVDKEIRYAEAERCTMDIYYPSTVRKSMPFVLMIHGGGWTAGDKSSYKGIAESFCDNGFAVVSINYSYASESTHYQTIMNEITKALSYIKKNAKELRLDARKTALMGHSAGGHLSLLYAYSRQSPVDIQFVVSMAGSTDFTANGYPEVMNAGYYNILSCLTGASFDGNGGYPAEWFDASPIKYVTPSSPKTIMMHGVNDDIVPYENSAALCAKLNEAGVENVLFTYPNSGHGLDNDKKINDAAYKKIFGYARRYLK